jgi:uncharacterized protein (UPF0335 family)
MGKNSNKDTKIKVAKETHTEVKPEVSEEKPKKRLQYKEIGLNVSTSKVLLHLKTHFVNKEATDFIDEYNRQNRILINKKSQKEGDKFKDEAEFKQKKADLESLTKKLEPFEKEIKKLNEQINQLSSLVSSKNVEVRNLKKLTNIKKADKDKQLSETETEEREANLEKLEKVKKDADESKKEMEELAKKVKELKSEIADDKKSKKTKEKVYTLNGYSQNDLDKFEAYLKDNKQIYKKYREDLITVSNTSGPVLAAAIHKFLTELILHVCTDDKTCDEIELSNKESKKKGEEKTYLGQIKNFYRCCNSKLVYEQLDCYPLLNNISYLTRGCYIEKENLRAIDLTDELKFRRDHSFKTHIDTMIKEMKAEGLIATGIQVNSKVKVLLNDIVFEFIDKLSKLITHQYLTSPSKSRTLSGKRLINILEIEFVRHEEYDNTVMNFIKNTFKIYNDIYSKKKEKKNKDNEVKEDQLETVD